MSLTADSPVHSSSSNDFAAILNAELDSASDTSPDFEGIEEKEVENVVDDDDDCNSNHQRIRRRKVEVYEEILDSQSSKSQGEAPQTLGSSPKKNMCTHPGIIGGMCIRCGQLMNDEPGVAFGYIHKSLRLANDEIARLRGKDFKNLLCHKKLYLVLDLDHTLLNSTRFADITSEERYLEGQRDSLPGSAMHLRFFLECSSQRALYGCVAPLWRSGGFVEVVVVWWILWLWCGSLLVGLLWICGSLVVGLLSAVDLWRLW